MKYSVAEPRIDRALRLQFMGDWGQANLHRICGWLSQEINDRARLGSKIAIWSGGGFTEAIDGVIGGDVDMAFAVPAPFVPMAIRGVGFYEGRATPGLRAIGTMPQMDRLVVALHGRLGIGSFEELRAQKPAIRIATSQDDGNNSIGYAARRLLEYSGLARSTLEAWGASFLEYDRPRECILAMKSGEADAIIHEAIMTYFWQDLANEVDLTYLDVEPETLDRLEKDFGWPRGTLPEGYLRGMNGPLTTLDFSDFLAVVRDDMPDDVAYLIAWCMCETREGIERTYRHIPPERSPLSYPLEPRKIASTSIPLHPGAAAYYRDAGVL